MKKSTLILIITLVLISLFASEIQEITGLASRWRLIPVSCIETDNGLDYNTKGTVTYTYIWFGRTRTRTYNDRCRGDKLYEYYCQNNRVRVKLYTCPFKCEEGACIKQVGGCYLELPNEKEIKIATNKEDCQSYSLAFQYADKKDVLRLVLKENPNYENQLRNEINNPKENYIIKYNNYPITNSFSEKNCEWIYFFGVPLYCFNGIYTDKQGKIKDNNLGSIIVPLTFLRMSSKQNMWNPLTQKTIEPFDFLLQEKIEYIDGTNLFSLNREVYGPEEKTPESITSLKIKDIRCEEEGFSGASNFQFRNEDLTQPLNLDIYTPSQMDSGEPYPITILPKYIEAHKKVRFTVFFCRTDGKERKIHYAGILYHEANHKLFGTHAASCLGVVAGDKSWKSVFGAHVTYLFQASQNNFLTCSERNKLYNEAKEEFETKLCETEHSYSPPVC